MRLSPGDGGSSSASSGVLEAPGKAFSVGVLALSMFVCDDDTHGCKLSSYSTRPTFCPLGIETSGGRAGPVCLPWKRRVLRTKDGVVGLVEAARIDVGPGAPQSSLQANEAEYLRSGTVTAF